MQYRAFIFEFQQALLDAGYEDAEFEGFSEEPGSKRTLAEFKLLDRSKVVEHLKISIPFRSSGQFGVVSVYKNNADFPIQIIFDDVKDLVRQLTHQQSNFDLPDFRNFTGKPP